MATTRRRSTPPADMNDPALGGIPSINPPEGTQATVNTSIKYTTPIDPGIDARRYPIEQDDDEPEIFSTADQLTDFLETYSNFNGYNLMVLRLLDPGPRRIPGQQFNRPNFSSIETLGWIPFDSNPMSIISGLQFLNGNSGGCFQIWLVSPSGQRVPDAPNIFVTVGDPIGVPKHADNPPPQQQQMQYYQPPPPQRSEADTEMERIKNSLFQRILERALEPPPQPQPIPAQLPGEDQAALFLFKNTDFLSSIFTKMQSLSSAAEPPLATGWKDRLGEAALNLATNNPQILNQVSGMIERVVTMFVPKPQFTPPPQPIQFTPPPPERYIPAQSAPVQTQPSMNGYTPQTEAQMIEDEYAPTEDQEEMEILEEVITLLSSDKPLLDTDPIFNELQAQYPIKFSLVMTAVKSLPLDQIIEYIAKQSPLYENMLNPNTPGGQYLRARIGELQRLCQGTPAQAPVQEGE